MLTSSLLITASSNRNADVIFADSSSSLLLNHLVNSKSSHGLPISEAIHAVRHVSKAVHISEADKLLFFISSLNYFVAFQLLSDFSSYHLHTTYLISSKGSNFSFKDLWHRGSGQTGMDQDYGEAAQGQTVARAEPDLGVACVCQWPAFP
ncbi:hypothetical protein F511_31358 [Dorcoceras hygrometricum]|uniref:Uncharacterized protein n=1 Tax=Dorcoceras hygrometricum TaxID=472368 RepID=A0A2Z7AFH6_9LAMI|nr:hypothetical protein F511_31358 [Dorcoceras hygrometricum]